MRRWTWLVWALLAVVAWTAADPYASAGPASRRGGVAPARRGGARAAEVRAVARGNESLALDIHRLLAERGGNVVASPLGVSTLLAMSLEGARGETRDALAAALRVRLAPSRVAPAFQAVLTDVARVSDDDLRLDIASALFAGREVELRRSFADKLERRFGARAVRLGDNPHAALDEVNRWAAENTDGLIPAILPPDAAPGLRSLLLANAVYFRGTWRTQFETRLPDLFWTSGGAVPANLMRAEGIFRTSDGENWRSVELPYRGGRMAMLLVVPDDLAEFESNLTPQVWGRVVAGLADEYLDLRVPPFAFDADLDLAEPLQRLGAPRAFDPERADFSRMVARGQAARLDAAQQRATVRVDEEGTVAAAVTMFSFTGMTQSQGGGPRLFRVDRPFLFAIRHLPTGTILFLGRVEDPTR